MSRFASPRPRFGQPPPADKPPGITSRVQARRAAMLQEATAALSILPGPGEGVHGIITGSFDLMHLLIALVEKVGPAKAMRITTLSYNRRNLGEMVNLIDGGRASTLTLLCSVFFRDHNKDVWQDTLSEFHERGQRAAAARSHAKVVTIEAEAKWVIEGSANLRSNGNREQIAIIRDDALHDWHAKWIDDLVSKSEGESDGACGKAAG